MVKFLAKLNTIRACNYINELERTNEKQEKTIEKNKNEYKRVLTELELEKRKNNNKMQDLEAQNKKLQDENNSYKAIIDKIPNWLIRVFAGKKEFYLSDNK